MSYKTYKGKYLPKNPKKYNGNPSGIIYRSMWERKFMLYCDRTDAILKWSSEEVIIPYVSPLDGRVHRYFPDFYIKMIDRNGRVREKIIEVKPHAQCSKPKVPKRKTKSYVNAVKTWTINEAK